MQSLKASVRDQNIRDSSSKVNPLPIDENFDRWIHFLSTSIMGDLKLSKYEAQL